MKEGKKEERKMLRWGCKNKRRKEGKERERILRKRCIKEGRME